MLPPDQPGLEHVQPTDGIQRFVGFGQFQQARLFHGLRLFPGDDDRVQCLGFDHRQREGVLGFNGGQPTGGAQKGFLLLRFERWQRDAVLLGGFQDTIQNPGQIVFTRQGKLDHGQFPFQFGRQAQPAADQDQGFVPRLGLLQDFLELPDQDRIGISGQEGVEIAQEDNGFIREFLDWRGARPGDRCSPGWTGR